MENVFGNIVIAVFTLFWVVIAAFLLGRVLGNRYGRRVTVMARVVDKQRWEKQVLGQKTMPRTEVAYSAVFELTDGKRKVFSVSAETFDGLKIGQRGELTYKGTRIHDFK